MRVLCFLFLLLLGGAVGLFAWQNREMITVEFWEWKTNASVAAVVGVAYALGMLSGWSIIGMIRRSLRRVTEDANRPATATW